MHTVYQVTHWLSVHNGAVFLIPLYTGCTTFMRLTIRHQTLIVQRTAFTTRAGKNVVLCPRHEVINFTPWPA